MNHFLGERLDQRTAGSGRESSLPRKEISMPDFCVWVQLQ